MAVYSSTLMTAKVSDLVTFATPDLRWSRRSQWHSPTSSRTHPNTAIHVKYIKISDKLEAVKSKVLINCKMQQIYNLDLFGFIWYGSLWAGKRWQLLCTLSWTYWFMVHAQDIINAVPTPGHPGWLYYPSYMQIFAPCPLPTFAGAHLNMVEIANNSEVVTSNTVS